ncbi:MAG: hypothetical protein IBX40_08245 [Methanosarcinales archaeon]|nr:hypothetical protein [Methanosarcinales archaeon]
MRRNSYRCTPTSKFSADSTPTDLVAKVAPHLEPTNYDRWSELYWKAQPEGDLTVPKAQIEKIKAHEWVVEGNNG